MRIPARLSPRGLLPDWQLRGPWFPRTGTNVVRGSGAFPLKCLPRCWVFSQSPPGRNPRFKLYDTTFTVLLLSASAERAVCIPFTNWLFLYPLFPEEFICEFPSGIHSRTRISPFVVITHMGVSVLFLWLTSSSHLCLQLQCHSGFHPFFHCPLFFEETICATASFFISVTTSESPTGSICARFLTD